MKLLKVFLPLLGFALLFLLLYKIGISSVIASFESANYYLIALMIFLFIPMALIQTFKWQCILKKQKIGVNFFYLLKLQLIALFYEVVTPAKVGYFIKIAYLKEKTKKTTAFCSSSVVLDRFMDFFIVFIFASIGAFLIASKFINLFYITIILSICLFAGLIIVINRKTSKFFMLFIYKVLMPKSLKKQARESFNEFYKNMPKMNAILVLFVLTFILWVLVYTQAYLTALAFGLKIKFFYFLFVFPIAMIISLIPISISGFGTRESALLVLFSEFEKNKILSFSIAWAFISLVFYSIIFLFIILKQRKEKGIKEEKSINNKSIDHNLRGRKSKQRKPIEQNKNRPKKI